MSAKAAKIVKPEDVPAAATRRIEESYARVFERGNPDVEAVLDDLLRFSEFAMDRYRVDYHGQTNKGGMAEIAGRQRVILRIFGFLNISIKDTLTRALAGRVKTGEAWPEDNDD